MPEDVRPQTRTEAADIIAITKIAHSAPIIDRSLDMPVLVHRDGKIESLERFAPRPYRKRATVTVYAAAGFIEYVKNHRQLGTVLTGVCDEQKGGFKANLDAHVPNKLATDSPELEVVAFAAGWGQHSVVFEMKQTPEWARWLGKNEEAMTQEEFAEFLEDMADDIKEPSVASLLEVAQVLHLKKGVNFRRAHRASDGQTQLTYEETIQAQSTRAEGGELKIPDKFVIEITPFVGGPLVRIMARLRVRLNGANVTFFYVLHRPDRVVRDVWNAERATIESALQLPVLFGSLQLTNAAPA